MNALAWFQVVKWSIGRERPKKYQKKKNLTPYEADAFINQEVGAISRIVIIYIYNIIYNQVSSGEFGFSTFCPRVGVVAHALNGQLRALRLGRGGKLVRCGLLDKRNIDGPKLIVLHVFCLKVLISRVRKGTCRDMFWRANWLKTYWRLQTIPPATSHVHKLY